jgi:hypothetical protein
VAVNDIARNAIFSSLKQITAMVNINVFSQILGLIDRPFFDRIVRKHDSDKHHKGINSWTHLVCMLFCHLSSADSFCLLIRSVTSAMVCVGQRVICATWEPAGLPWWIAAMWITPG